MKVNPVEKDLGQNKVKALREDRDLSCRALAVATGLSHSTIARIENGERKISTPQAIALASYFGVTVDYLIGSNSKVPEQKSTQNEPNEKVTESHNEKKYFRTTPLGYIQVYLPESPMAGQDGWAFLHRVVMAESIGRPLKPEEVVHHKDGDPGNNKLSNLMLFPNNAEHRKYHGQQKRDAEIKRLLEE